MIRSWLLKNIEKDINDIKEKCIKEIKEKASDERMYLYTIEGNINNESFVDEIVERIKRKQL